MVLLIATAAARAIVRVKCPKCGHSQARARVPQGTLYACRECKHKFTLTAGLRAAEAEPPKRKRASR